jgi:hypothetical protein
VDQTIYVTNCGRICLHRKKINLSTVFAGQAVGIKEFEEGIWLVRFMNCDLGLHRSGGKNSAASRKTLLAQKCPGQTRIKMVGAKGFEPSTSWSRTSNQIHLSRCPGVTYRFSSRSLLDKFGQVGFPAVIAI